MNVVTKVYNAFAGVTLTFHPREGASFALQAIAFTTVDAETHRDIFGTLIAEPGQASEIYGSLNGESAAIRLEGENQDGPIVSMLHGVTFDRPPIYTMGIQDPDAAHKLKFVAQRYIPWTRVAA